MPVPPALLPADHGTLDQQSPPAEDLAAIRLLALPELGPPFDDSPAAAATADAAGRACATAQGADGPVPGAASADSASPPGTRPAGAGTHEPGAGTRECAAGRDWTPQFALLLTEALSGARPARQVLPLTTERARAHLNRLKPLFSGGQRPRIRRVITTRPTPDVIEMTVVMRLGTRTRALAMRLERAGQPERGTGPGVPPLARSSGEAVRPGRQRQPSTAAARWLCTDIEAA